MRRVFSALLVATTVSMAAVWPAPATGAVLFDLQGHWARPQVEAGIARGYVAGYPDGTFRPDAPITRAEFYKLLGAAMRLEPLQVETGFREQRQTPAHWSFGQGYVPAAVAGGLLNPSDYAGEFGPDARITRREIVLAAVRALGKEPLVGQAPTSLTAPDWASCPGWLRPYAALAVGAKVVAGYEDGSLGLERNATRAEALVMVQRIAQQVTVGLTNDAGPADETAVRHPAEGEPTWSWRTDATGRVQIRNGTVAQDYSFADPIADLALRPAPGHATWVRYRVGAAGVIARLWRGRLTEVSRYDGTLPEPLAVDDDGRLWFDDGARLQVAGADGKAMPVADVNERVQAGAIDWNGNFWGASAGHVYRVDADQQVTPYPLEMRADQQPMASAWGDDGSLWLLLRGAEGAGPRVEAVQVAYGKVTHRYGLLGPAFGGAGSQVRVTLAGRSGPFLWLESWVQPPGGEERRGGLYRFSMATGECARLVLPRTWTSTAMTTVSAPDGGALLRDDAGAYWRLLP